MKTKFLFFAVLMFSLLAFQALAADDAKPVGYVQEAKGQALAVRGGQSRELAAKGPVFVGDTVATKAESSLQIMFSDGTILAMGPESLFSVDEFVNEWGQDKTFSNTAKFTYGPGVFRAVTGVISDRNPRAFSVDTPLGAIGIRGTELGSLVQAPAAVNGKPYSAALAEVFSAGANAAGLMASLRQAAMADVPSEAHGHINGTAKRPLAFTDKKGKTVDMAVGQGVTVSRERGASESGPISNELDKQLKTAPVKTSAKVPAAFKNTLGDTPGSNNNGGDSDSGGGCSG
ncbi:FecR domain-containing protein [Desulfovibrio sulfodismutans]|uniref:FecR domain-containing protein n=1 Tax=Desulfolutivibrio sulfodismutans TaxID=63561 RepID=A0A7K3NGS6_9BACT|nr:FecR domain-containing protein [Desulfolutivibrio sulfodismutans]NDY55392.1 FecR domain-containing protein [Desulfolutivibrio sulfodismutans]